jgi:hypothetical protein
MSLHYTAIFALRGTTTVSPPYLSESALQTDHDFARISSVGVAYGYLAGAGLEDGCWLIYEQRCGNYERSQESQPLR